MDRLQGTLTLVALGLLIAGACSSAPGASSTATGGSASTASVGPASGIVASSATATSGIGSTTASGTGGASTTGSTSTVGAGGQGGAASSSSTSGSSGCMGGGLSYSTDFGLTENPISEGGSWVEQGGLTGVDWTNVQTKNGVAFGTLTGNDGYNDSIALLSGFGPDYRVSAVVHFVGQRSASTSTHEVELMLRGSYSPKLQHVYECNLGYSGAAGWYSQIVVLDGPIGTFTDITQGLNPVPDIKDGDVFTAEVIGNVINTYVNGVQVGTATDGTLPTGQPGVGFFWRATENVDDFGFTSFCATAL